MITPNHHEQPGPYHDHDIFFGRPNPPSHHPPAHPQYFQQPPPQYHYHPPGFLDQFRKPDGNWDYDKMINHGGQILSIINQARPLVKQMEPLLSLFRR